MTRITPVDLVSRGAPMSVSDRSTRELVTGNWRTFRPQYVTRPSPCQLDCPAGTDVRAFLTAAADDDAVAAWRIIREHNPFPGICGRVCYHACETDCNRLALDEAVAIHLVERAVSDEVSRRGGAERDVAIDAEGPPRRVAIVGAGPAGMSCAYHLARRGHLVTLFDAAAEPGGMLRYGIPAYRLPRPALDTEIDQVLALGIAFRGNARLGGTLRWDALGEHDAVFLGVGAQRSRDLGVDDPGGVASGLEFLRDVNRGHAPRLDGRVAIIGGGNTAVDVARVVLRLGGEPVVIYRRSREDMPAHPDEVAQAQVEGVRFMFHAAPARVFRHRARVTGVEIQRTRPGARDATGRPRPEPIPGAVYHMRAQHVFAAVGEEVELDRLGSFVDAARGRLAADRWGRTRQPAVFAGGDAATGAGTVVDAIGSGRRAAEAIDAYLAGRDLVEARIADRVARADLNLFYFRGETRVRPRMLERDRATAGFDEVVGGLAWDEAAREAARCFTCGACTLCDNCRVFCPDVAVRFDPGRAAYDIDLAHCKGCGVCVEECPGGAITLVPEQAP